MSIMKHSLNVKWLTIRMEIVALVISPVMILGPEGYVGLEVVHLGSEDERDGEGG
jgi:hypothetical protein